MKTNRVDYFSHAKTWSTDIYSQAVTVRNWSILFALLSLCIAVSALITLFLLLPLKENTPFLVFVDHQLGEPVTIQPVSTQEFIENEQLKKYMIRKFIIARERYNTLTLEDDADVVYYLSSEDIYRDYQYYLSKFTSAQNSIDVAQLNISFLNASRAYVSFVLVINEQGVIKEIPATAQIKFHFSDEIMPASKAYQINPVNFTVDTYQSHYQINQEV